MAFSTEGRAYVCEAYSKKQMKVAGINMKLDWQEVEDFEKAKREIFSSDEYELKNATNVSNFKY